MNHSEWLQKEADLWLQEQLITSEQRKQLHDRYPAARAGNPLLLFFAVIGSLLIGAGVILIFATNWWRLSVPLKLVISFLPLLAAQAISLYVALRQYASPSYREGSGVLLSLSFFAALALIGQIFHTPSDLETYLLVCGLFTLPVCYLLRSKAALLIFVASAMFAIRDWQTATALFVAVLPFFYVELRKESSLQLRSYLLLLLSALCTRVVFAVFERFDPILYTALTCGIILLLVDAVYRKLFPLYFFTPAKLLGTGLISLSLFVCSLDFTSDYSYGQGFSLFPLLFAALYPAARAMAWYGPMASDAFVAAAAVLSVFATRAGIAATVLMLALGVGFIVWGSRKLRIAYLNTGMLWLMLIIGVRFFDSSQSLLTRGIVFILLGIAFLLVNIVVSRKRKEQSK